MRLASVYVFGARQSVQPLGWQKIMSQTADKEERKGAGAIARRVGMSEDRNRTKTI